MIEQPNYTQIPNSFLDDHMRRKDMSIAELKICLAVARQTFGWHKQGDKLSLSQLEELTGLSRQGVINGVNAAINSGLIVRIKDGDSYQYSLNISDEVVKQVDYPSQVSRPVLVKQVDQQVVKQVDTQKKVFKEKKERVVLAAQEPQQTATITVTEKEAGVTGDAIPSPYMSPVPLPTEQQRKFGKLCEIVGWDSKTIGPKEQGQVAQTLGILTKAGYTEEHLNQFFEKIWSKDWRWQNNRSYPTLSQVRAEIGKLRTAPDQKPVVVATETKPQQPPMAPYLKLQQRKGYYTQ